MDAYKGKYTEYSGNVSISEIHRKKKLWVSKGILWTIVCQYFG